MAEILKKILYPISTDENLQPSAKRRSLQEHSLIPRGLHRVQMFALIDGAIIQTMKRNQLLRATERMHH